MRSRSQKPSDVRLVLVSDTHELHRELDVPDGEIFIHAGDFTMFSQSHAAILDFNRWLGELPHPYKIVVPGNHEFFLHADESKRSLLSNAIVLINEAVTIGGLRIWGSPTTPLSTGAFGIGSAVDRVRLYRQIPKQTDILVSHGPPFGIGDSAPGTEFHSGDRELLEAVEHIRPKLHVFGHVHGANGLYTTEHTMYVNAALLGRSGGLDAKPIVLRMRRHEKTQH